MNLSSIKSVHFIGIGGIGISAIARMMLLEGKKVSGSDRSPSLITDELARAGAKIFIGHDERNIGDADLVIYTIAVPDDNPEILKARKIGLPLLSYPEALGLISGDKFTISISGTHGKTTTTAMIGKMMIDAGLDPTVIVGSLMNGARSNLIVGKSDYFVVESCEYRRSFLNLHPKIIVITNIDNDHLDYYRDFGDIQSAFSEFVARLGPDDYLITDVKNVAIAPVIKVAKCEIVDYQSLGSLASKLKLRVPGRHNIENAKVALALARVLGIDEDIAIKSLNNFSGTWRRFEFKGVMPSGAEVYDDYGHHPTEIKATLQAAREKFGEKKKIVAVFQPHLYSRTKLLLREFAGSFADADEVILLPIYAAREMEDKTISSDVLAREISKAETAFVVTSPDDREQAKAGFGVARLQSVSIARDKSEAISLIPPSADVIITIGAGDVTEVSDMLTR